jgi:hypothetical protein
LIVQGIRSIRFHSTGVSYYGENVNGYDGEITEVTETRPDGSALT